MAKILFVRSLPLDRDARSTKMISEYRRRGHIVTTLFWSRGAAVAEDPEAVVCTARGGYGRGLRGLSARIKFFRFLAAKLISRRRRYDVIHLVDFDTGVIGVPIARLLGKPIIYDAFDHIGAMTGEGALGKMLSRVEQRMIEASTIRIFPDAIRLEQYGIGEDVAVEIISNIPDLASLDPVPAPPAAEARLRLVYIGTLERRHRGLELIPVVCERDPTIEVVVGGNGELDEFFYEAAARLPNLIYLGHQTYDEALAQMAGADALFGPYLLSAPAHRYASPNKTYEHLALGKPLITNSGTPPARLVEKLGSGFLFDGTSDSLVSLITGLTQEECQDAGKRARSAWNDKFSNLRLAQLDRFFSCFDKLVRNLD